MGVTLFRGSAQRVAVATAAFDHVSDRRPTKTGRRLVTVLF